MNILVLNAGSSSLKYQLFDASGQDIENWTVLAQGVCERIGMNGAFIKHKQNDSVKEISKKFDSHKDAIEAIREVVDFKKVNAIGHRVVHSGVDFTSSVLVNKKNFKIIESNCELAPLHMPAALMGLSACMELLPNIKNVAVFDTVFHSTMPEHASLYAIDYNDSKKLKIKRYGFHGMSHQYVSQMAIKVAKLKEENSKVIVCHLGNGASISAVLNGKCIDTSMGLTPLEGLIMGTRSGDIDASVVDYLSKKKNINSSEVVSYLNKKSGLKGISGISSDFRDLNKASGEGNLRAKLALDMFAYRVKKYIGSYIAALNGVDCIAFCAGAGEHNAGLREAILSDMDFLGIKLDKTLNKGYKFPANSIINAKTSKVKVAIIPTNEEVVIAQEVVKILSLKSV